LNAEQLKKTIADILPKVDTVIGYGQGFDPLHSQACFITTPEEIDTLILNPLCEYNLAGYLPSRKKKKTAVVVKGCDSRTIVQFLQEGLLNRENGVIVGCEPSTSPLSSR